MAYIDSELFEQELRRRAEGFCAVCSDYEHCIDEEIDRRGSHKYCWKPLQLPTADVVEVKHGEWIEQEEVYGDTFYTCSVCNNDWTTIDGTPQENFMNIVPIAVQKWMEVR